MKKEISECSGNNKDLATILALAVGGIIAEATLADVVSGYSILGQIKLCEFINNRNEIIEQVICDNMTRGE